MEVDDESRSMIVRRSFTGSRRLTKCSAPSRPNSGDEAAKNSDWPRDRLRPSPRSSPRMPLRSRRRGKRKRQDGVKGKTSEGRTASVVGGEGLRNIVEILQKEGETCQSRRPYRGRGMTSGTHKTGQTHRPLLAASSERVFS